MSSIADRATSSVFIPAGRVLTVSGDAVVTVSGSNVKVIGSRDFGPYATDVSVVISAVSGVSYSLSPDSLSSTAVDVMYQSGKLLTNGGVFAALGATSSRIHAAIAQAWNNNPQVLPSISAAPTWATSTLYGMGQIVRGTAAAGAQNNLYMLAGSTTTTNVEGTSAAAGNGPSGTGAAVITDNTCVWIHVGRINATDTTTPFISTASLTASTDEMNGYVQPVSTATALAIGLTSYRPSTGGTFATEAYFTGGLFGVRNAERVGGPNGGSLASPSYPSAGERGSVAFCTNARKWIALNMQSSYFLKNVPYEILVNGRYLSETPLVFGADQSGGSFRVLLLNMAKFPEGKKTIEIRVYDNIQSRIAFEVYKEADDQVWPTENPNRFRMAFEGDSITVGSYICQYRPRYWIERIIGDQLGCDAVYNNAVGGTGMVNNGGTKTTYLDRLPDLVAFQPDIVFVGGIQNDTSYTSAQRQAAVTAYLTSLRSALPSALVVVLGIQPLQGQTLTTGSSQHTTELDVSAAVSALADPSMLFIPLLTGTRLRLSSANGRHFQSGSAPYNDTHPVPAYYPFIGGYIAEKIRAFVLGR